MKRIISNTSPLIALSIINKLDLLWKLFDEVFISEAVYIEVCAGSDNSAPGKRQVIHAVSEGHIQLYRIIDRGLVEKMYGKLHRGELETIVGCRELNADFVLIDERAARNAAKFLLLNPIGTIGLLRIAKYNGEIDQVKPHIDILMSQGFRVSHEIYTMILKLENEE